MGFKKPLNLTEVSMQVRKAGAELRDYHNDGFIQFEIKKELYQLKWLLDEILEESSRFVGEDEFLEEHYKEETWRKLKK